MQTLKYKTRVQGIVCYTVLGLSLMQWLRTKCGEDTQEEMNCHRGEKHEPHHTGDTCLKEPISHLGLRTKWRGAEK